MGATQNQVPTANPNVQGGGATTATTSTFSGNSGSTTLTVDQIPSHNHTQAAHSHYIQNWNSGNYWNTTWSKGPDILQRGPWSSWWTNGVAPAINNTGGGTGHTHTINHSHTVSTIQPFTYVYMYRRKS